MKATLPNPFAALGLLALGACQSSMRLDPAPVPGIMPLRDRVERVDGWLAERLDQLIPSIMRGEGFDTWIVMAREYNEDPVIETMLPANWMAARRRTILVLHDDGREVQRFAVARYDIGSFFPSAWDKEKEPDQWRALADLLRELRPKRIAINVNADFALGDGLSAGEERQLRAALGEQASLLEGDHHLAIRWLETRTASEMEAYPTLCSLAHQIIGEGFRREHIQPGMTTTADLEWWYREKIAEWKLGTWFHPSVSLQRADEGGTGSFASHDGPKVIEAGDLLHVDFGITYLGLNTDTQQHAYVLAEGEQAAPAGLLRALAEGNRLQDILMNQFETGRSGNEILAGALQQAKESGIEATIYTHPLGFHGHGAGPTIGLWDQQGGVPGRGDYGLQPQTAHSIELMAMVEIPEWNGQGVRIMLEEDAFFDGEHCRFIDGRQTEFHLIQP